MNAHTQTISMAKRRPYLNHFQGKSLFVTVQTVLYHDIEVFHFRTNYVEALIKKIKSPSSEDLTAATSRLSMNLDMFGDAGAVDFKQVGLQMLPGAASSSTGLASIIKKITALVKPKS